MINAIVTSYINLVVFFSNYRICYYEYIHINGGKKMTIIAATTPLWICARIQLWCMETITINCYLINMMFVLFMPTNRLFFFFVMNEIYAFKQIYIHCVVWDGCLIPFRMVCGMYGLLILCSYVECWRYLHHVNEQ